MKSSYSHFVASRQGLYAVNPAGWKLLAEGLYFGLTLFNNTLYAFESVDRPRDRTSVGRIMAMQFDENGIVSSRCVAQGLDNGCHQIDFIGDRLHVVDTYQQRITVFSSDFKEAEHFYPVPPADYKAWDKGYVHCNSLVGAGEYILLLLHNGGVDTGRPSRLMICDQQLRPVQQLLLPGKGCHNLVVLEDGSLLACDSLSGSLINHERTLLKVDDMMTRGLAVGRDQIVVGSSMYTTRRDRIDIPGRVHFFDRAWQRIATVELPAAPTEIRRMDGQDLSISNYAKNVIPAHLALGFWAGASAHRKDSKC